MAGPRQCGWVENADSRTPYMRKINDGSHGKPCANHVRLLALESEGESCGIIAPLRSYIIYGRGEGECLDLDL